MAVAMLGGCGASQPPTGAPGATTQTSAIAGHAGRGRSWMLKVLHVFKGTPDDGAFPAGSLIALRGEVLGATGGGGSKSAGTIFEINASGAERVIYSFNGDRRGRNPDAGPIAAQNTLYGTTVLGGTLDKGMIYELSTSGLERVLYSFKGLGRSDGWAPDASLVLMDGGLYGTTYFGGAPGNCGTVFTFDLTSGKERVLYRFQCGSDGGGPADLIRVGDKFYGVTLYGGTSGCVPNGCGTVYEIDTSGHKRTLYRFKGGIDGLNPSMLVDVSGRLYGMTGRGGASYCSNETMIVGCGTIFEIDASGHKRTVYSFEGPPDGAFPNDLITGGDTMYGTTAEGGTSNLGTVFQVEPSGKETVLVTFAYSDNASGPIGLLAVKDGFYGTTDGGGYYYCDSSSELSPCGTVFTLSKSTEL